MKIYFLLCCWMKCVRNFPASFFSRRIYETNFCLKIPQPKSDKDHKTRKETEINIDNFKNFHARRRWKHSMKVVALCNKLSRSRSSQLRSGESAEPVVEAPVVSNMTTGKTAEVSFWFYFCPFMLKLFAIFRLLYGYFFKYHFD